MVKGWILCYEMGKKKTGGDGAVSKTNEFQTIGLIDIGILR